ncbi:MAG TPA: hypothetical protein VFZ61_27445 [Polyangiales bacterium]
MGRRAACAARLWWALALTAALGCTGGQTGTPTSEVCTLNAARVRADVAELTRLAGSYAGPLTVDRVPGAVGEQRHPVQLELRVHADEVKPWSCGAQTSVAATLTVRSEGFALDLELRGSLTKTPRGAELVCDGGADAQCTLSLSDAMPNTLALDWDGSMLKATELTLTDVD